MLIALIAFITGILVGLTGTGAGVILTPLLLFLTPFSAVTVIGTDLLSGAVTKLAGVFEHRRLGQVQWRLAAWLLGGSLPGTLAGIALIRYLELHYSPASLDHFLRIFLGATLFGVSVFFPFLRGKKNALRNSAENRLTSRRGEFAQAKTSGARFKLALVGAVVGFFVSMTSVGSGSLLMIALLALAPLPIANLVGTDILVGLVITALAGGLHLDLGHFNGNLFLLLLAGEVPGVVLGSRLTRRVPERALTWLFTILYFSLGTRLLLGW